MRKRWVLGAFSGWFFGMSLSIILVGLHVVKLDSILITLMPVIFLVLGIVGAEVGPRRPKRLAPAPVGAPPDVSEYTGSPPNVPPPPSGEPVAPPAEPPTLSGDTPPPDNA